MAKLLWRGAAVIEKVRDAAGAGIDTTLAECVHDAALDHPAFPPASEPYEPYANRTGFETGAIHSLPAADEEERVVGHWGAYAPYALFLEIGTSRADSGHPDATEREAQGAGNMDAIPPPSDPPLMAPRPFLRPAADRNYPRLAERIGVAFRAGG